MVTCICLITRIAKINSVAVKRLIILLLRKAVTFFSVKTIDLTTAL